MTVRIRNTTDKPRTWSPVFRWEPGQAIDVEDHHFANQILTQDGFALASDPVEEQRLFLARLHRGTQHPAAPKSDEITAADKARAREIAQAKEHPTAVGGSDAHHDDTTGGWQPEATDDQGADQRLETAAKAGTGRPRSRSAARKR